MIQGTRHQKAQVRESQGLARGAKQPCWLGRKKSSKRHSQKEQHQRYQVELPPLNKDCPLHKSNPLACSFHAWGQFEGESKGKSGSDTDTSPERKQRHKKRHQHFSNFRAQADRPRSQSWPNCAHALLPERAKRLIFAQGRQKRCIAVKKGVHTGIRVHRRFRSVGLPSLAIAHTVLVICCSLK